MILNILILIEKNLQILKNVIKLFRALTDEGEKYIMFIWIVSPIILILQMVALISTIMFVIYLIKGGKYDDDDEVRDYYDLY